MKTLSAPTNLLASVSLVLVGLAGCGQVSNKHPDGGAGDLDGSPDQPDARVCAGTVDDCGVCDGNNADMDCAGDCFGGSTVDMCGVCDGDPGNDCVQDCNGTWGGDATLDGCGVCDSDPSNDCWLGQHGTTTLADGADFDIGSGTLFWSISGGQIGYFYAGGGFTNPPASIADAINQGICDPAYSGYNGINTVQSLGDASALAYSVPDPPVKFGSLTSNCNMGLLVYRQGAQYGVIEFVSIDAVGNLTIEYWVGDVGVTNFSNAP